MIHRTRRVAGIAAILLLAGAVHAEDADEAPPPRPWVNQPSPAVVAKFRHWRLKTEESETPDAPERGIFASWKMSAIPLTVRLVKDVRPSGPLMLTAAPKRTRYLPEGAALIGDDERVTQELMEALRTPEVSKFIEQERLERGQLELDRDLADVLVQDFDAALRVAKRKERVWSINWRLERHTDTGFAGYEAWGLFTRVNGALKPFYLAGRQSSAETPGASSYYVLAVGD